MGHIRFDLVEGHKMKVGDLIREFERPQDQCGVIVQVGDAQTNQPYKVFCTAWQKVIDFGPEYIHKECEVVSESR